MIKSFLYKGFVSSCLSELSFFVENLMLILKPLICDDEVMFDLKLIINELMINGVVHGNEHLKCKQVSLTVSIDGKKVRIIVEDEGKGVDYSVENVNSCSYDSHGRGLLLVDALSDGMITNKNKVIVIKKI